MLQLQNNILERVALGEPLELTARALCQQVEALLPGVVCSILTVGADGRLHPLASPSLPVEYSRAFDGLEIGPDVGSCGTAIFLRQPVEARDIATDPRWAAYAALPLALGLRACWSTPIIGRDGTVFGAFAFYFREVRSHTELEEQVVRASIHLCAIALERDQLAEAQHRLAYRDMLTGLPNRAAFNAAAERLPAATASTALLLIDLDNLKTVNDTFGHRAGDQLIQAAASSIERSASPHHVFRLGGDEFAVLFDEALEEHGSPERVADRILQSLAIAVDCDGHFTVPRATIGGATWQPGSTPDDLRQNADFALYHAKETRRGGYVPYSPDLGSTMTRRLRAIQDVGAALRDDRIDAHYQPIVRLDTGEIVGLEALFRVVTPTGDIVSAGDYFEATSDVHTATRLTKRMVDIVARDVRAWLDQGIWFQHVGINASSADFQGGGLHQVIKDAFDREDVSLEHVILEVTESVYMGQAGDGVAREIQSLRANGLRVALDDFGTGFASLTHLLSVPVDIIKIDKSFVARMEPESRSAAIVEGLMNIAGKLDIRVVAEGVETESQAAQLRNMGCNLAQGYLYSRPANRAVITKLLFDRAQKRDPHVQVGQEVRVQLAQPATAKTADGLVRYAVLLCGNDWRVVSERRQLGHFSTRSAAFQCALRLAREANASGSTVELLHTDDGGELRAFRLGHANQFEETASVQHDAPACG
ncbi:MAG: EAL domain-containing protein [Pseudomonas sp.]|uniref:putative bifunctional diguanylate cyclase/phosphodiesterase n=1 Tax=Pseudomonas sp. TaxID=306 RepID=UPI00121A4CC9|nr:EAL domain-containing protein [Pseudomonas sp.]RZI70685.1 MAG: EAL domain-containing protein [Pseudomonas sp.]